MEADRPAGQEEGAGERPVIAFFDLDHTLIDGSNGNIYAMQMVREGLMPPAGLFWVVWFSMLYKMNRLPQREVYRKVLDIMGQYTVLEMIGMMDRGFEEHILPRIFRGGAERVRKHGMLGHVTVIATAAGEYIAERMRAQLGADAIIATETPILGDHMTSSIEVPFSFMEGKLEMAREFCCARGADLADCYFYSDSASDLPLLEAVGHPVMVNPQLKLRRAARGRGWPVLKFTDYALFESVKRPGEGVSTQLNRFMLEYETALAEGA